MLRAKAGDGDARNAVVLANQGLVYMIARNYASHTAEMDDLVQEGNIGLIRAIQKFEPERGIKFSTYATFWVQQRIRGWADHVFSPITIPKHAMTHLRRFNKVKNRMRTDLRRDATAAEAWAGMVRPHFSNANSATISAAAWSCFSLDAETRPEDGDGMSIHEMMAGAADECEAALRDVICKSQVKRAVGRLPRRMRTVVRMRHGLDDGEPKTLQKLATFFGISRERVRQIELRSMARLRAIITRMDFDGAEPAKIVG